MHSDHDKNKGTNYHFTKRLLSGIRTEEAARSDREKKNVHDKILSEIAAATQKKRRKNIYMYTASVAAILLLLLVSTYSLYLSGDEKSFDTFIAENINEQVNDILVLSENGSKYKIENNSHITCTPLGSITIKGEKNSIEINDNSQYYKVIVPEGKRTSLNLMDNSQVVLNAGTVFTFPKKFTNKTRTVSLTGEGFFRIKKSQTLKQFKVMTQQINICVLGTEFNVASSAEKTEVVLVKGSVSIESQSDKRLAQLKPGEMFTSDRYTMGKQPADTYARTCWVDNIMLIDNLPLTEVVRKIAAHYNTKISIANDNGKIMNGKLDLTNSVEEIIKTVSAISGAKLSIIEPSTLDSI